MSRAKAMLLSAAAILGAVALGLLLGLGLDKLWP